MWLFIELGKKKVFVSETLFLCRPISIGSRLVWRSLFFVTLCASVLWSYLVSTKLFSTRASRITPPFFSFSDLDGA